MTKVQRKTKKIRYPIHIGDTVYQMIKLTRMVRNHSAGILAAEGITGYTFPQTTILVKLRETAGMSAAELARVAMVRPQTINKILVKLYADGLIEAKDDPAHGRIRRIFLTRHGKQITEKFDKASNLITSTMFRNVPAAQQKLLEHILNECIDSLNQAGATEDED